MKKRKQRSVVAPISAQISSILRNMGSTHRSVHPEIWARWFDIAGSETYKRAFPQSYRQKILTIGVSNSSWLQELSFLKNTLIDKLAEEIGPGVVTDIKFVLDINVGKNRSSKQLKTNTNNETPLNLSHLDPAIKTAADKIQNKELRQSIKKAAAAFAKQHSVKNKKHSS